MYLICIFISQPVFFVNTPVLGHFRVYCMNYRYYIDIYSDGFFNIHLLFIPLFDMIDFQKYFLEIPSA